MSVSEALHAALVEVGAATSEEIVSGQWVDKQCPYVFKTLADGRRQLTIDKGEALYRVIGATNQDAVAALVAKVKKGAA